MNPKRAEELIDAIDQIYRKYLSEYVDDAPPDKIEAYREEAAALLLVEMRKEREALAPYLQHKPGCDFMKGWPYHPERKICTCGLAAILRDEEE